MIVVAPFVVGFRFTLNCLPSEGRPQTHDLRAVLFFPRTVILENGKYARNAHFLRNSEAVIAEPQKLALRAFLAARRRFGQ